MPNPESEQAFESGTKLSYTVNENSVSSGRTSKNIKLIGGRELNTEKREVELLFDTDKKNCRIRTRRVDITNNHNGEYHAEPLWREIEEDYHSSVAYGNSGEVLYTNIKGTKDNHDLSYLIMPYPERAEKFKEVLKSITETKGNVVVEEFGSEVVKLSQVVEDVELETGNTIFYTMISYINTTYGIPVISETYNAEGKLQNKLTLLYKMINDIPVVAYEESISYSVDYTGEEIEHKVVTSYENINLSTF